MWRKVDLDRHHGSPPMRSLSASAMMGSKLYVFGGLSAGPANEFWALDFILHRWERIRPAYGKCPTARSAATLAGDDDTGRLFLFGGLGAVERGADRQRDPGPGGHLRVRLLVKRKTLGDCWSYDPAARVWSAHTFHLACPSPRRGHTANMVSGLALDAAGDGEELIADEDLTAEAAAHDDATAPPEPGRAASREPPRHMVVLGGAGQDPKGFEAVCSDAVWALDISQRKWRPVRTTGCVGAAARFAHTSTQLHGKLFVVGGMTLPRAAPDNKWGEHGVEWGQHLRDVSALDLKTLVWTRVCLDGPRIYGHSAAASPSDADAILVFGGREALEDAPRRTAWRSQDLDDEPGVSLRSLCVVGEPKWTTLFAEGEGPAPSAGMLVAAFSAKSLNLGRLWRDRGPELEHLGLGLPAKQQKRRVSRVSRDSTPPQPAAAAAPGLANVKSTALCNEPACVVFFGGSRTEPPPPGFEADEYGSNELFLYDVDWQPPDSDDGSGGASPFGSVASHFRSSRRSRDDFSASSHAHVVENDAELNFFRDTLARHSGALPHDYATMKLVIAQRDRALAMAATARNARPQTAGARIATPQAAATRRPQLASLTALHGAAPRTLARSQTAPAGLRRSHTAPAAVLVGGLDRANSTAGFKGEASTGRPPSASRTALRATRRPRTARPLTAGPSRDVLESLGRQTIQTLPPGTTIWRARELFLANAAMRQ